MAKSKIAAPATASTKIDFTQILSTNNPVFMVYITWTGFLIIKMLLMSFLTAIQRFINKVSERINQ